MLYANKGNEEEEEEELPLRRRTVLQLPIASSAV